MSRAHVGAARRRGRAAVRAVSVVRPRARPRRRRSSASSRRRSGSRSSNSRKTSRRRERSGSRAASATRSTSTGMSRTIVASSLEIRASSACSVRFSLRLAPEISSTLPEHVLERAEALQQLGGGLVADARDAGDVVRRVALEAVEVGDQLGRDAVAVDDGLVVVDLRVGDAARGGHDPHAARPTSWKASRSPVTTITGMPLALRALGDRGDHVVGLEALDAHVAVAEGLDERLEVRPLLLEQVGPRRALGLVVRRRPPCAPTARRPTRPASARRRAR